MEEQGMMHHEIEAKYLISNEQQREHFLAKIAQMPGYQQIKPLHTKSRDIYMILKNGFPYIYRYRYDTLIQQLSVKSLADTFPVRQEINLNLGGEAPQQEQILAFFKTLGLAWHDEVVKDLLVYRFPDCEVVLYTARFKALSITCIEIEAMDIRDVSEGLQVLARYQRDLDIVSYSEETQLSVFQLLIDPQLPADIKALLGE
jgi:hypothetical protein